MYRDPYEVRASLRKDAYLRYDYPPLLAGGKGVIIGMLNKQLLGDEVRHIVLAWLFDYRGSGELPLEPFQPKSTRDLSEGQWLALNAWIKPYKDEVNGGWDCDTAFKQEVLAVARVAVPLFYKANHHVLDELLDLPPFMAELKLMGGEITDIQENSDHGEKAQTEDRR